MAQIYWSPEAVKRLSESETVQMKRSIALHEQGHLDYAYASARISRDQYLEDLKKLSELTGVECKPRGSQ